jgi:hypothetical protein
MDESQQQRYCRLLAQVLAKIPPADRQVILARGPVVLCDCENCVGTLGGDRAFATCRVFHGGQHVITVNVSLCDSLSDSAVIGILAHEVGHALIAAVGLSHDDRDEALIDRISCERWPFAYDLAAFAIEYGCLFVSTARARMESIA